MKSRLKFILELINKVSTCTPAEVGRYVMHQSAFIDNDEITQFFIRSIKKRIACNGIFSVNEDFLNFAKEYIQKIPLNILFIGSDDNHNDFIHHRKIPGQFIIHHIQIKDIPIIKPLISDMKKSELVIFYDRQCLSDVQDIIAGTPSYLYAPYNELKYLLDLQIDRLKNRTLHHYSLNNSLTHYLENENISQVIIGSSYPWAAFPQELLEYSSNISMHCADITFSTSVLTGLQSLKPINNAVLLLSPYDLYYELALSRNNDILSTFNALKNFCREHNMEYNTTKNFMYDYIFNQYSRLTRPEIFPLFVFDSLLLQDNIRKEFFDRINFLSHKDITPTDPSFEHIQHYIQNDLNRKHSRNFKTEEEHISSCHERAAKHSRHFNYKESHPRNIKHINRLIAFAEQEGIMINVIMSPFPKEYLQALDENMIAGSRHFFSSVQSKNFQFIDLLDCNEFTNSDFYDGDHLNYSGAEKLYKHLNKLGVVL